MEFLTPRLHLREFVPSDWEAVRAYQSDPRYLRYYAWTGRTEPEVRAFVGDFVAQQAETPRTKVQLAITLRAPRQTPEGASGDASNNLPGTVIGNCGLRTPGPDTIEGDLGYELAPWHWGHGYATEAARVMVAFGFERLGLHRIWAECVAENLASARVLEKLGMRLEGRLRENRRMKGRSWDTLIYAILDREWRSQRP